MKYNFMNFRTGESLFVPGKDFRSSAYVCAMRTQKRYGMKFQGVKVEGGLKIICVKGNEKNKTQHDVDIELVSAAIDWGTIPDVMTGDQAVESVRKLFGSFPRGRSGQTAAGLLIMGTGKYRRTKVTNEGKQIRLYVRIGVTRTGVALLKGINE